jgi:molybdate transport system substrate-binding protein
MMQSSSSRPSGRLARQCKCRVAAALLAMFGAALGVKPSAAAETIEIYAAGSLRTTVEELAKAAGPALGIDVKPTFYSSGALRERIEKGEKPDLFLSADMDSPRKLAAAGRTVLPVVAFARNRMCLIAKRSLGVTPQNLIDRMLAKEIRIRTSEPVADPAGDYAVEIFDRIDARHPGAGKMLRDKAQAVRNALAATPRAPAAELFKTDKIDMAISYCSGASAVEKEDPETTVMPFPSELEPRPVDGIAILSDKPGALRLALYLLSEKGQAIVSQEGLLPILDNSR